MTFLPSGAAATLPTCDLKALTHPLPSVLSFAPGCAVPSSPFPLVLLSRGRLKAELRNEGPPRRRPGQRVLGPWTPPQDTAVLPEDVQGVLACFSLYFFFNSIIISGHIFL